MISGTRGRYKGGAHGSRKQRRRNRKKAKEVEGDRKKKRRMKRRSNMRQFYSSPTLPRRN